jgi:AcrR family transcriptional regulator
MADVAERAKVNPTSLYRRWGDMRLLAGAVAVDRLMRELPVPDTGCLRDDITGWAASVARSLSTRRNVSLLQIMAAVPKPGLGATNLNELPIGRRVRELEAMLARGKKRGEKTPELMDILEIVLAPIYLRALFLGPIKTSVGAERLVDRALALTPEPRKRATARAT